MTAALRPFDWRDYAACRDVDADKFFPEGDLSAPANAAQAAEAKRVCSRCTVRPDCLESGASETFGIWGGLTEDERNDARLTLTRGVA